jgi:hypothetical protein
MGQARSGEIEFALEKLRLSACLIRSVRVEQIVGRCLFRPVGAAIACDPG